MINSDRIDRKELDSFAANLLINFALINTAAIAAMLSAPDALKSISAPNSLSVTPYAIGLMAAIMSQLLWYVSAVFDYEFGKAEAKVNETIGSFIAFFMVALGGVSAGSIIYGGFILLGVSAWIAYAVSAAFCIGIFVLLVFVFCEEKKYRFNKPSN